MAPFQILRSQFFRTMHIRSSASGCSPASIGRVQSRWKLRRGKRQRLAAVAEDGQQVLHTFWRARGVTDYHQRERLIEVANDANDAQPDEESEAAGVGEVDTVLPGAQAYWHLEAHMESRNQVDQ